MKENHQRPVVIQLVLAFASILVIFAAGFSLFYLLQEFFQWYLTKKPLMGVDFYNTVTYVSYLKRNFIWPWSGYKDIWFTGVPLYKDTLLLHYYLILPLTRFFSVGTAVKYYVLGSTFLFFFFSFLLYSKLSKNYLIAFSLSALSILSVGYYGSLVWGGSLPYYSTQMFLPLILLLIVHFHERGNISFFAGSVFFTGMAFTGHPLLTGTFILPAAILLLLFGWYEKKRRIITRILLTIAFVIGAFAVSFRVSGSFITYVFSLFSVFSAISAKASAGSAAVSTGESSGANQVAQYYQSLSSRIITFTPTGIFVILAVAIISLIVLFIFRNEKKKVFGLIPYFLFCGYIVIQIIFNAHGISFLNQGWYRQFWVVPLTFALLAAAVWGNVHSGFTHKRIVSFLLHTVSGGIVLMIAVFFYLQAKPQFIASVDEQSSPASAYPESLEITESDSLAALTPKLLPSWLSPDQKQYRVYTADAQVNVWWSSAYSIPLARGYIDPPVGTNLMGNMFLLDQALGGEGLVKNFKYDEAIARNMGLFYIDWYGINTYEGGHVSLSPNPALSTYLQTDDIVEKKEEVESMGVVRLHETKSGKPEIQPDVAQYLNYTKFSDAVTAPIASATNSPYVLFFTDISGFEYFNRMLSAQNYNSQKIIPVRIDKPIESVSKEILKNAAAVVLYNYTYSNKQKAFSFLKQYVSDGGMIFIDTGSDYQEGQADRLPDFFPFKSMKREVFDTKWDMEKGDDPLVSDISFEDFGPPEYEGKGWKFSYPDDLGNAVPLLNNHGKTILAKWDIGNGSVVWSGMNLPFHFVRFNKQAEADIVLKTLQTRIDFTESEKVESDITFNRPGKVTITPKSNATGVLLKQELWPNWSAISSDGKKLPILSAGPTYFGFIYVLLPPDQSKKTVTLTFNGTVSSRVQLLLSYALSGMLIFEFFSFGMFTKMIAHIAAPLLRKHMKSWWEKEED